MKYNEKEGAYIASVILKQGYYNYQYVFVDDSIRTPDISFIEGNHYETENEYVVLVYHKGFGSRFDKLTAFKVVNSKNIEYNNY